VVGLVQLFDKDINGERIRSRINDNSLNGKRPNVLQRYTPSEFPLEPIKPIKLIEQSYFSQRS
jgi:hypothetical protein